MTDHRALSTKNSDRTIKKTSDCKTEESTSVLQNTFIINSENCNECIWSYKDSACNFL